jgi:hypothetical protein
MHLPEHGHISGRNMYEAYYVYNTLSYTYVHLLALSTVPKTQRIQPPRGHHQWGRGIFSCNSQWLEENTA